MPKRKQSAERRPGRFQVPPPALLRSEREPFEGFDVLDEVRSPAGLLLCSVVRDTLLWASVPEGARVGLFAPGAPVRRLRGLAAAEMDETLRFQLNLLSRALSAEPAASPADVAAHCRGVARRAEESDLPRTAIAFAQAAALALPHDAECALQVGRLCRRSAQYTRAESWYRRAIGLARRRDAQSYARAWLGLGNLWVQRGDYAAAERAFQRALRVARRAGLRNVRGEALHDLFSVAVEARRITEAEVYAQRAARAYGARHPRLPVLAHDVACFWMHQGFFDRALRVFQAVVRLIKEPTERLKVVSNTARAAGGAGTRVVFLGAWTEVWQTVDARRAQGCIASSVLNLAYGSAHLEDWERVDVAARFAADLAKETGEKQVRAEAEALLEATVAQRFVASFLPSPDAPEMIENAEVFADVLVRKLAVCANALGERPRIHE